MDGTQVIEITESLPNGDIVRLVGNGWHPRSRYFEIITDEERIKITDMKSMKVIASKITEFLAQEKKLEEREERG